MPRVKQKTGGPSWYVRAHILEEARPDLVALLSIDKNQADREALEERALSLIEYALGAYSGGVTFLDHAPRAADYRDAMKPLTKQAVLLAKTLTDLNPWMVDALLLEGVNVSEAATFVGNLVDAAHAVSVRYTSTSSSGHPKTTALEIVVQQLRQIFAKYASKRQTVPSGAGPVRGLSAQDSAEARFVAIALKDARIGHLAYWDEKGARKLIVRVQKHQEK